LKILFLTYYFFPHVGGATWTAYNICKELERKGHDVLLLAPYVAGLRVSRNEVGPLRAEFFSIDRYPIPRLIAPFVGCLRNFCRAGACLKREKYDLILIQYHPHHLNLLFGLILARIFRLPLVVKADDIYREMGTNENSLKRAPIVFLNTFNELLIRYSDLFLVVDLENKKALLHRRPKIPKHLVRLSPNGFAALIPNESPNAITNVENRSLLFVGRFSGKEYGVDLLLEAMTIVRKSLPKVILILVGDNLTKHLQKLIDRKELNANVRVIPPTSPSTIIQLIHEADLCIGPLLPTQTIPLKVLQYMTCGKPVISGFGSISSELAIDGTNCLLVKPTSVSIAEAIIVILTNPKLANQLGKNASVMVKKFSWENIVENMLTEIELACSASGMSQILQGQV
jgi:glycosyltransferase involved in cell wall biosynthesis